MGRTIAKGKFETPRGGAASSTGKSGATKTRLVSKSVAAKQVRSKKKSGSKTGMIVGGIVVVAICVGVGLGLLWKSGLFSTKTVETTPEVSAQEEVEVVEELDNKTEYTAIYPNVYIGELSVGGMTEEEALTALQDYVSGQETQNLWVTLSNDEVLTFTVTEQIAEETLQNLVTEAWNHGRDGTAEEQAAALTAAEGGETYTVALELNAQPDTDALREQAEAYAEQYTQEMQPTEVQENAVQLEDGSYVMEVTKGISGTTVDAESLYQLVSQAALAGNYDPLEFTVETVEPEEPDYETLESQWNKDAVNASYDVSTASVVEGTYGYSVSMETLQQMLAEAEEGATIQVPVTILEPEIDKATMEASLFADTLSSKSTVYASNANRTENLRLACAAINGTVIQPGDTFSFNDVVGQRTEEKGYKSATVYANGGKSEEQTGGGICQVASTIYYCTLYANLEVVERTEHMYRVEYIDYGLDATVYWGSCDYKFRNNTNYPIKILANIDGGSVNITFLGTKTDDTYVVMEVTQNSTTPYSVVTVVDESKPVGYSEVTQTAYTGYSYTSYRCVYDGDGNLISRTKEADSVHNKRDRIITVGPSSSTTTTTTEPSESPSETVTTTDEPTTTTDTPTPSETTTQTPTTGETTTTENTTTENTTTENTTTETPTTSETTTSTEPTTTETTTPSVEPSTEVTTPSTDTGSSMVTE